MADVRRSPAGIIIIVSDIIEEQLLDINNNNVLKEVEDEWNAVGLFPRINLTSNQFEVYRGSSPIPSESPSPDHVHFLVYSELYTFGERGRLRSLKTPQIGDPNNTMRMYVQIKSDISGDDSELSPSESLAIELFLYAWAVKEMIEKNKFIQRLRSEIGDTIGQTTVDVNSIDPILPDTETFETLPNVRQVLLTFTIYTP